MHWDLNAITGSFALYNQTTKTQFIQVVLDKGSVAVFTLINGVMNCYSALGGNSVINSTVCEVPPGNSLNVDFDFNSTSDACGTYQIEMG